MTDELIDDHDSGRDALIHQIAAKRARVERRGVQYLGIRWHGDAEGRQSVDESISAVEDFEAEHGAGSFATSWKGLDGWADNVGLADLRHVRRLLADRRQACFRRERELVQAVEAGEGVDMGAGWPD